MFDGIEVQYAKSTPGGTIARRLPQPYAVPRAWLFYQTRFIQWDTILQLFKVKPGFCFDDVVYEYLMTGYEFQPVLVKNIELVYHMFISCPPRGHDRPLKAFPSTPVYPNQTHNLAPAIINVQINGLVLEDARKLLENADNYEILKGE